MVKLTESLVLARSRSSDLENVRKLNCWGSDLTDISILRKMTSVTVVSLSVNKIQTLADFGYCKNLEELYIRKNNISDLTEICHLKKLAKLRILWLADNPCAVGDRYRYTVLKALPNLQKLDNVSVTEDDVNEALEQGVDLQSSGSSVNGVIQGAGDEPSGPERSLSNSGEDVGAAGPAAGAGAAGEGAQGEEEEEEEEQQNPAEMSWHETNKIRQQLGLKPLSVEKVVQTKPRSSSNAKNRNANVLQAALCLVKELDGDSLEVLADAIRNRLDVL